MAAGRNKQTLTLLSTAGEEGIGQKMCICVSCIHFIVAVFSWSKLSAVETADCGAAADPEQPRHGQLGPLPEVISSSTLDLADVLKQEK